MPMLNTLLLSIILINWNYLILNSQPPPSLSTWLINTTHFLSFPTNYSQNWQFKCPWISCLAVLPHILRIFWAHFSPAQTLFYWKISTHPLWANFLLINYPCLFYQIEMHSGLYSRNDHKLWWRNEWTCSTK